MSTLSNTARLSPLMRPNSASGISYYDSGPGTPTILCLHGIQGSKDSFQPLANRLLRNRVRLLIPDIPGFGASPLSTEDGCGLSQQARVMSDFIRSRNIDRLVVYGHSLGGMLGTLLLEQRLDNLVALISSEGNLRLDDCGESRKVAQMSFEEFRSTRYPELQKKGVKTDPLVFYQTAESVVATAESERLLDLLNTASCPVLFIRGGASHFSTVPTSETIQSVVVPGETHLSLSSSQGSIEAIERFIEDRFAPASRSE